jgi:hypothetical protein
VEVSQKLSTNGGLDEFGEVDLQEQDVWMEDSLGLHCWKRVDIYQELQIAVASISR